MDSFIPSPPSTSGVPFLTFDQRMALRRLLLRYRYEARKRNEKLLSEEACAKKILEATGVELSKTVIKGFCEGTATKDEYVLVLKSFLLWAFPSIDPVTLYLDPTRELARGTGRLIEASSDDGKVPPFSDNELFNSSLTLLSIHGASLHIDFETPLTDAWPSFSVIPLRARLRMPAGAGLEEDVELPGYRHRFEFLGSAVAHGDQVDAALVDLAQRIGAWFRLKKGPSPDSGQPARWVGRLEGVSGKTPDDLAVIHLGQAL